MGSMFSGIGGLDLGLEWGIKDAETVWQIEMEPFGRSILAKHWPDADRSVTDVRKGNAENLAPVDLISGGFPCQDISVAGNQKGFDGEKSSLWHEMSRIIGVLRPRFIVLENVAAIVSPNMRSVMARVMSDIRAHGYNAEWQIISAAQCGAPHLRRRFFLIGWLPNAADAASERTRSNNGRVWARATGAGIGEKAKKEQGNVANAASARRERLKALPVVVSPRIARASLSGSDVANADNAGREYGEAAPVTMEQKQPSTPSDGEFMADTLRQRRPRPRQHDKPINTAPREDRQTSKLVTSADSPWASGEPLDRVVNGLSKRLARRNRHALRALGNAVVPQCAELVGRRVQEIREILDNE